MNHDDDYNHNDNDDMSFYFIEGKLVEFNSQVLFSNMNW